MSKSKSRSKYSKTEWVFGDISSLVEQFEEGGGIYNDPSSLDSWGKCESTDEDTMFNELYPDLLSMWDVFKVYTGVSHV